MELDELEYHSYTYLIHVLIHFWAIFEVSSFSFFSILRFLF
jgi:hypothetical protein